ncbi:MAG: phage head-tail joining protein [Planktomarina sp.]
MANLDDLKKQLAKLREIRANGIQTYSINNRSMTYRSDRELASAIADLESQIRRAEQRTVNKVRIRSTKGLS